MKNAKLFQCQVEVFALTYLQCVPQAIGLDSLTNKIAEQRVRIRGIFER